MPSINFVDNVMKVSDITTVRHRILGTTGTCYYHVLSRVIERRFIFGEPERVLFRRLMRQQEAFSGVRVLTWTCLSNHFHILVAIDDRSEESPRKILANLMDDDDAFLARLRHLYLPKMIASIRDNLNAIRSGTATADAKARQVASLKQPFLDRMFNLSCFVGEIKQRLSQWYNRKHDRLGPLWEDRFKSVLVQGEPGILATVAAYIDLNSVRAGIVKDPRDWRWCGYAEAVAAQGLSRNGVYEVLGIADRRHDGDCWKKVHRRYRSILINDAIQLTTTDGTVARKGITREQFEIEHSRNFELPAPTVLHQKVRYFIDGLALGSREFIETIFAIHRSRLGVKRSAGARVPRASAGGSGLGDLRTLRDLRSKSGA